MKKILFILVSMIVFSANASEIKPVKITDLMMDNQYGQQLYVKLKSSPEKNSCNTNSRWDYVLNSETEVGEDMLSLVLLAYSGDMSILISSNNQCDKTATAIATRVELFK